MLEKEKTTIERQDSVISTLSAGLDLCRICQCDSSCGELISPCYCSGSLRWVHQVCLQHWIRASGNKACELCRYPFCMRSKLKPPCQWEALPMSSSEKRRFFCSAIFHSIALGCVIWSLYVLIERTVQELKDSTMEWQFWTKIVVEAIGCLGAGILIYVWGKSYFSIVSKWIAFNRTFLIVNSTPIQVKRPPSSTNINMSSSSPALGSDSSAADKSREAKALLLPPVVYSPPESAPSENF
ncbi:unnamed protein product [Allacma fusca]|uniref:RING-CH-type domain-containing protein n=1 Tax=Allacma fusca TaxID=39272 RepID=A0A8J2NQA8_9HEXA|nr:unnamed protein product [Allacma fusca]